MKRLSPSEQERRRYSRQLAAHTLRQWSQASGQQTQATSSDSSSDGREGVDERPTTAEQDKVSQPYHAKKGPRVIDFALGSSERRKPSKKGQSDSSDRVK